MAITFIRLDYYKTIKSPRINYKEAVLDYVSRFFPQIVSFYFRSDQKIVNGMAQFWHERLNNNEMIYCNENYNILLVV